MRQRFIVMVLLGIVAAVTVSNAAADDQGIPQRLQTLTDKVTILTGKVATLTDKVITLQNGVNDITGLGIGGDTFVTFAPAPSFTHSEATIASLALPPGTYVVMVTLSAVSFVGQTKTGVRCLLEKHDGVVFGEAEFDVVAGVTQTVSFHGASTLSADDGSVNLRCSSGADVGATFAQLTAIRRASLSLQ